MSKDVEHREREDRAARLVWARKRAGFAGPQAVADRFGFNVNNYKAHESGRNGFSASLGDRYADAFGVSRKWLYLNIGGPDDRDDSPSVTAVPLLSMVSAGNLMRDDVSDEMRGLVEMAGLPEGDWIALEVEGTSMDRISPPGSKILVNRRDKRLVPNACYVIADVDGNSTYKRYRPNPDRFEPVSTFDHPTIFPEQDPVIVGRVKVSLLEM